jgi:hypothetical protein
MDQIEALVERLDHLTALVADIGIMVATLTARMAMVEGTRAESRPGGAFGAGYRARRAGRRMPRPGRDGGPDLKVIR